MRLLLFLALFAVPVLSAGAAEPITLRVLSYNIHHGEGTDRKLDLGRIAKVIQSVSPDLVSLQEVDKQATRSGSVDQGAELARMTGMKVVFGGNIPLQGGEYGNAILSKWDFTESNNLSLPNHNDGEQRGVLSVSVNVETPIAFLATHFDHRRDDSERLASASSINAHVSGNSVPSILAGDINATRDSAVLDELRKEWTIAGDKEQPTIPAGDPHRQIDFVFFRPANRWRVIETKVLPEAVASDHRALLAVLELQAPTGPVRLPRDQTLMYRDPSGEIKTARTLDQWQLRREQIVRGMQTVTGEFPQVRTSEKLRVKEISEHDCGSYLRRRIAYQLGPGLPTTAFLCIPKIATSERKVPAVLCLHPTDNNVGHQVVVGLGGKPNRQYAAELAERGYVTIAPSYPLLATYQPDLEEFGWQSGTLKAVWDNMRAIDVLETLPYVDKDAIGAIGHSLGGHNAVFTAVLEPRIKAIVSSCGLDSFLDYYGGDRQVWVRGKGWTSDRYMPKLANYAGRLEEIPFDFHELIAALAPRHTLIIAPWRDSNFQFESVDRVAAAARDVFELHHAGGRLRVEHPDCGHDFPNEMRELAYEMFDDVLKR